MSSMVIIVASLDKPYVIGMKIASCIGSELLARCINTITRVGSLSSAS